MKYEIAIPSYKRPEVCRDKTLAFLNRVGIDPFRITVFVPGEAAAIEYRKSFATGIDGLDKIGIQSSGPIGLLSMRCWYHSHHYLKGTKILNLDDDVEGLFQKNGTRIVPLTVPLDELVRTGFIYCDDAGAKLWGVNGVSNGFYLKDQVTVGLRYLIGCAFGSFAGDPIFQEENRPTMESSGEDFQTTLLAFEKYGSVVRFDGVCPKTNYFAPGGIEAELRDRFDVEDRQVRHAQELRRICMRHPELASIKMKAGGVTNIRLRTITHARWPLAFMGAMRG